MYAYNTGYGKKADVAELNPFIERGRITDSRHFAARWGELSLLFGGLETRTPVFVVGSPAIGKSSLLTHVVQSAAINLERFDLRAFSLDLAVAQSDADVYRVLIEALGRKGTTSRVLHDALAASDGRTLLCLDNADAVLAQEWAVPLLDDFARLSRAGLLMLVVAQDGEPPILSERVAVVRLGAFSLAEVRLMSEAYLEGTGVSFMARNLRRLHQLSVGHPAYLQRAAYHLFVAKLDPDYNWVAAYLAEAKERPIPGAPLPPAVFAGASGAASAGYDDDAPIAVPPPPTFDIDVPSASWLYGLPILLGLVVGLALRQAWLGFALALIGLAAVSLALRAQKH